LTQGSHLASNTGGLSASIPLSRQLKGARFDNVAKSADRRSSRRNFTSRAPVGDENLRQRDRKELRKQAVFF